MCAIQIFQATRAIAFNIIISIIHENKTKKKFFFFENWKKHENLLFSFSQFIISTRFPLSILSFHIWLAVVTRCSVFLTFVCRIIIGERKVYSQVEQHFPQRTIEKKIVGRRENKTLLTNELLEKLTRHYNLNQ